MRWPAVSSDGFVPAVASIAVCAPGALAGGWAVTTLDPSITQCLPCRRDVFDRQDDSPAWPEPVQLRTIMDRDWSAKHLRRP